MPENPICLVLGHGILDQYKCNPKNTKPKLYCFVMDIKSWTYACIFSQGKTYIYPIQMLILYKNVAYQHMKKSLS